MRQGPVDEIVDVGAFDRVAPGERIRRKEKEKKLQKSKKGRRRRTIFFETSAAGNGDGAYVQ